MPFLLYVAYLFLILFPTDTKGGGMEASLRGFLPGFENRINYLMLQRLVILNNDNDDDRDNDNDIKQFFIHS